MVFTEMDPTGALRRTNLQLFMVPTAFAICVNVTDCRRRKTKITKPKYAQRLRLNVKENMENKHSTASWRRRRYVVDVEPSGELRPYVA